MPFDTRTVGQRRTRWIALDGHLEGVEIMVLLASPAESQKFRNDLVNKGILPVGGLSTQPVMGREDDYYYEVANKYVLDWRGKIEPEGTRYDARLMGFAIGDSINLYRRILE